MSGRKVWFITGAGRGMGVDFATAALAAGDAVVATGRNPDAAAKAFNSAYCAAKFGLEGWTEALQPEVAPFGIHTTIVNPGFFRTELLTQESTTYAEASIADYAERHAARQAWYEAQNGQQAGDPAKLAKALIMIAGQEPPPRRFIAGADAIAVAEQKVQELQEQINAYRDLSTSLARAEVNDAEDRR
jgi:NAD(P)-dependent dehydrogenase (short-subunit alcohol dehydrogenase family)